MGTKKPKKGSLEAFPSIEEHDLNKDFPDGEGGIDWFKVAKAMELKLIAGKKWLLEHQKLDAKYDKKVRDLCKWIETRSRCYRPSNVECKCGSCLEYKAKKKGLGI